MTFEEYQKLSRKTAIYPDKDNNFEICARAIIQNI